MPSEIGTWRETDLHRQLKNAYAGLDGQTEVDIAGFVADGVNASGEYIEVQGASFGPFLIKARKLASQGRRLKVIHPIIVTKHLEVFDADGEMQYRRKSSRRGSAWDLFGSLIYAPEMPLVSGLEIELALVDVAEHRVLDGKGSWRRNGASIRDRRLLDLRERICLARPSDYLRFVPFARNEEFTVKILGAKAGIRAVLAKKTLYVLAKLGIVEKTGKLRNAHVYRLLASSRTKKWKKLP